MMNKLSQEDAILEKLDILIKLQATSLVDKFDTQKDKISFLNKSGITPKGIAEIIGTTPNSVSVALSKMKKSGGSGGEGKE